MCRDVWRNSKKNLSAKTVSKCAHQCLVTALQVWSVLCIATSKGGKSESGSGTGSGDEDESSDSSNQTVTDLKIFFHL